MSADPDLVYLDHAATTATRPETVEAMLPWLTGLYGNPSGAHAAARDARRAIDDARDALAEVLGSEPGDVVFTSGGTEADNLAITGVLARNGGSAVTTAAEHHAVLHPVEASGGTIVGVDRRGIVDLDALAEAVGDDTTLVSVMLVNNELGAITPLERVVEVVKARNPRTLVHTDAVQALSWLDLPRVAAHVDLLSISAHKFGGPQGVGVLVVRDGVDLSPLQLGGGQERERRSGTHNVAGIVGMAAAARATAGERRASVERIGSLRARLVAGLRTSVPGLVETGVGPDGDRSHLVAGICHVCIPGVESEALLFLLERDGIAASAASSCASGAQQASHVLASMGVARELAVGSLRLSLNHPSTDADIDAALAAIPGAVAQLRAHA